MNGWADWDGDFQLSIVFIPVYQYEISVKRRARR